MKDNTVCILVKSKSKVPNGGSERNNLKWLKVRVYSIHVPLSKNISFISSRNN